MLWPGLSRESTSPAESGSDTAAKITGILLSSVAACIAIATGVATPTIRSTSLAIKSAIIWLRTLASVLQFSTFTLKVTPFSSPMALRRASIFSIIWLREASSTKLQIPME